MMQATDLSALWASLGPVFLLMLSTFLLGYGLATYFSKKSMKQNLLNQKKNLEELHNVDSIKDIDIIFTEIKPKIIDIVNEAQQKATQNTTSIPQKIVAEKAKSTYVSYTKQEATLDLTFIGRGTPSTPDDLTKIEGIGPYVEERLNNIGIFNYEQISKLEEKDIRIITELIEFFPGRIERDTWVEQAKSLLSYRSQL